ncbi:hypothetical protein F4776DRAFT_659347 [Hypoxylon sp. NC0597]|nr:hypothetical protein F4776DRAFT_659347 [Hypoxylon sp. NC0597]
MVGLEHEAAVKRVPSSQDTLLRGSESPGRKTPFEILTSEFPEPEKLPTNRRQLKIFYLAVFPVGPVNSRSAPPSESRRTPHTLGIFIPKCMVTRSHLADKGLARSVYRSLMCVQRCIRASAKPSKTSNPETD